MLWDFDPAVPNRSARRQARSRARRLLPGEHRARGERHLVEKVEGLALVTQALFELLQETTGVWELGAREDHGNRFARRPGRRQDDTAAEEVPEMRCDDVAAFRTLPVLRSAGPVPADLVATRSTGGRYGLARGRRSTATRAESPLQCRHGRSFRAVQKRDGRGSAGGIRGDA